LNVTKVYKNIMNDHINGKKILYIILITFRSTRNIIMRSIRKNSYIKIFVLKKMENGKCFQKNEISETPISLFVQLEKSLSFNLSVTFSIIQNMVQISQISNASLSYVPELSTYHNSELPIEIFTNHLRCWVIEHHIAQTAVNDLLKIMKLDLQLHSLSSDIYTILKIENVTVRPSLSRWKGLVPDYARRTPGK